MQLALFTPGAYIWPVHRSFEAFVAALGTPACDAPALDASALYPARVRTDSLIHGLAPRLDERLRVLHRELYEALLRPTSSFKSETRSVADVFWPDLQDTAIGRLLAAFYFFFVRRDPADLAVVPGLSVLRAVFFSHEAAEPEIWLLSALERLEHECAAWPCREMNVDVLAPVKFSDLHFAVQAELNRPLNSPAWLSGRLKRQADGRLRVQAAYGVDPALKDPAAFAPVAAQLEAEVAGKLSRVFGWDREVAA